MDCAQLETEIWAYVDRELPARRMAELSSHLRDCDACRRLHEERCREARVYRSALTETPFGDEFVERFRSRMIVESSNEKLPNRDKILSQRLTLALIIFVIPILAFVIVGRVSPEVETLGSFRTSLGQDLGSPRESRRTWAKYRAIRGAHFETVSGFQTYSLRPGFEFEVAPACVLEMDLAPPGGNSSEGDESGTRLLAYGSAFLVFPATSTLDDFRARLELGRLECDVAPLSAGQSFEIDTPDAVVKVVGTRFTVDVLDGETRVSVEEGRVEFTAKTSGDVVFIDAGSSYRVRNRVLASPEPVAKEAAPAPIVALERAGSAESAKVIESSSEGANPKTGDAASGGAPKVDPPVVSPSPPPQGLDNPAGPDLKSALEDEEDPDAEAGPVKSGATENSATKKPGQ